jgi:hypothetical protein
MTGVDWVSDKDLVEHLVSIVPQTLFFFEEAPQPLLVEVPKVVGSELVVDVKNTQMWKWNWQNKSRKDSKMQLWTRADMLLLR